MTDDKRTQTVNLEVELDEQTSLGMYVNMAVVQHSSSEFIMDFIQVAPGRPKAKVRARIIMTPDHAKQFLRALSGNIQSYEQRFGEIKVPDPPPVQPPPTMVQ